MLSFQQSTTFSGHQHKGIDEEIPAVKDLLAEPQHPGGIATRSTVFARVSVVWMRARVSCWHSGVICD